jgi:hypothetical protein
VDRREGYTTMSWMSQHWARNLLLAQFAKTQARRYVTPRVFRMLFHDIDCAYGCTIHTRRCLAVPWRWRTTLTKVPDTRAFIAGAGGFSRVADLVYRPGLSKSTVTSIHQSVIERLYSLEKSDVRFGDAIGIVSKELAAQGFLRPATSRDKAS